MVLRAALDVTLNDPLLGSESAMPLLEAPVADHYNWTFARLIDEFRCGE
jgi:hypothetical protein